MCDVAGQVVANLKYPGSLQHPIARDIHLLEEFFDLRDISWRSIDDDRIAAAIGKRIDHRGESFLAFVEGLELGLHFRCRRMLERQDSQGLIILGRLIQLLDQLLHQIERFAPTDEQQSVGRNQWRNRNSPLPSPDEFFLYVIDQFRHRFGIHMLQRRYLDRRFALAAGLIEPFDDLRKVRQLLIAASQNDRIELGQHLDLHPLELR